MNIGEEILKSIDIMINRALSKYKADKTFPSIIKAIDKKGKYVILENGCEHSVKCSIPNSDLKIGTKVWVKIPNGDFKGIHICGIIG